MDLKVVEYDVESRLAGQGSGVTLENFFQFSFSQMKGNNIQKFIRASEALSLAVSQSRFG